MDMAGLQRSAVSFRRQGSSGLVWEDRLGDLNQKRQKEEEGDNKVEFRELRPSRSVGSTGVIERSKSNGGRVCRSGKVSPAVDPPSPKVSGCGFCAVFGKPVATHQPKSGKRKA